MPQNQVAAVSVYDVNAPVEEDSVLVLRTKYGRGGKVRFNFRPTTGFGGHDQAAEPNVTVSIQVSTDGVTYADTTANNNGTAVVDAVIQALTDATFEVVLRAGTDLYVQVLALGGARLQIQVSPNEDLELVREGQDLTSKGPIG